MKGKVSRRKYDAAFKEEVLQMVFNGRPVSEVARSLGIGENIIYRWKNRHKAKENKGEEQALPAPDYQALHRRIRELETERDILKKPWLFSVARPKAGVQLHQGKRRQLAGAHALCRACGEP